MSDAFAEAKSAEKGVLRAAERSSSRECDGAYEAPCTDEAGEWRLAATGADRQ